MAEPEAIAHEAPQGDLSAKSVAEHLNSLLVSADTAAQRIVHEAESRAQEQLAEVDRRMQRMEAEAAQLTAWKQETEQMVRGLAEAIGEFSRDVAQIPRRIDEALGPLSAHVPQVVRQIDELRAALGMTSSEQRTEAPEGNGTPGEVVLTASPMAAPLQVLREPDDIGEQVGEIQMGWLPGWEDMENGTR